MNAIVTLFVSLVLVATPAWAPRHGATDSYPFAHANPVFVIADGEPIRSREDAAFFVTWIEGGRQP